MKPLFFASSTDFRNWLMENHQKETELVVGFYKVGSGKPSMTWSQSVDEALCFGWIDGIRRSIDKDSYCIRFTQRKPTSNWSAINIRKIEELTRQGLMQPAGLESYQLRKEDKSRIYTYENKPVKLAEPFEERFKANKNAWVFFTSQAPSYQKTIMYWVMSAKQTSTQLKRLEKLIAESELKKRVF
jgi:uncharacterized protein YdeI (YjbR/CyaY-like superfamily)